MGELIVTEFVTLALAVRGALCISYCWVQVPGALALERRFCSGALENQLAPAVQAGWRVDHAAHNGHHWVDAVGGMVGAQGGHEPDLFDGWRSSGELLQHRGLLTLGCLVGRSNGGGATHAAPAVGEDSAMCYRYDVQKASNLCR